MSEDSVSDKLDQLRAMGFARVGCWTKSDNSVTCELSKPDGDARNVLYAFAVDDELMYVGKTVQPLRTPMVGYKHPGSTQSTNIRNNRKIRECLADHRAVEIFVLRDNGLLTYGGFHVNLAAGLEDSLVRKLMPPWNGGEKESPDGSLQPIELPQV
jgi:hypothetical protein